MKNVEGTSGHEVNRIIINDKPRRRRSKSSERNDDAQATSNGKKRARKRLKRIKSVIKATKLESIKNIPSSKDEISENNDAIDEAILQKLNSPQKKRSSS